MSQCSVCYYGKNMTTTFYIFHFHDYFDYFGGIGDDVSLEKTVRVTGLSVET